MKACVFTLGCKVNQYESFAILRRLAEQGYEVTEDEREACDLYVLNSCAVTAEGERKSRQLFHRIRRAHPDARVVVCGCASQRDAGAFSGADLVLGTGDKFSIPERCDKGVFLEQDTAFDGRLIPGEARTRAYVKIQDGCDNFCSYCIVPHLRGRSRSRDPEEALREICASPAEEVVLTGINLSDYGRGVGSSPADFLRRLARSSGAAKRIRLGSLEVGAIDGKLLDAAAELPRFCPQFHLSLQSGSDEVLRAMNRRYTRDEYLARCELIRQRFPRAALTTDVIVGFPTETEADFAQTYDLCRRAEFFEMHIFPYSRRRGTPAEGFRSAFGKAELTGRLERLHTLQNTLKEQYLRSFVGEVLEVLAENETFGHARNYIGAYGDFVPGTCRMCRVVGLERDGVRVVAEQK